MAKINMTIPAAESEQVIVPKAASEVEVAKAFAEGLPSPAEAALRSKLRQRTQMNFAHVPTFVKADFDAKAKALKMTKVEYLYHLMRLGGHEIPEYGRMDRRTL